MKKLLVIFIVLAFTSGCGASVKESGHPMTESSPGATHTVEPTATPIAEVVQSAAPETSPSSEPIARKEDLSPEEKIAFSYIDQFLQSESTEEKLRYVTEVIHSDKQYMYWDAAMQISRLRFDQPAVVDSVSFEYRDQDISLVLIRDDASLELMMIVVDSKIYWGFLKNDSLIEAFQFETVLSRLSGEGHPFVLDNKSQANEEDCSVALAYMNDFFNSEDVNGKMEYYQSYIHPEVLQNFYANTQVIVREQSRYKNPEVADAIHFENAGIEGTLVLIQSKNEGEIKEMILLVVDGKMANNYRNERLEEGLVFDVLREQFQAPLPE